MSKTLQEWRKALRKPGSLQWGAGSTSGPGLPGSWLYIDIFVFIIYIYIFYLRSAPLRNHKEPTLDPLKLALAYLVVGGLSESRRASPTASKARWQFLGLGPVPPRT